MSLGGRAISSALLTFEVLDDGDGTALVCTHQAVFYPPSDGPERRKGGWEALFIRLDREMAAA